MMRRPFTLLPAVSLVLCVGTCILWVRSESGVSGFWLYKDWGAAPSGDIDRAWFVRSASGNVELYGLTGSQLIASLLRTGMSYKGTPDPEAWDVVRDPPVQRVPYLAVLACAALPAACLGALKLRDWSQRQPGLCSTCGYDLRATPDRCSECGAVPGPEFQIRTSQNLDTTRHETVRPAP